MKSTGIVRRIDELGRVVLPIELRRTMNLEVRDPVEIFMEGDAIVLKKYEASCLFCGVYDEVRMYDGTATADRVKADYDTMNNPASFLVEYRPKGLIIVFE